MEIYGQGKSNEAQKKYVIKLMVSNIDCFQYINNIVSGFEVQYLIIISADIGADIASIINIDGQYNDIDTKNY